MTTTPLAALERTRLAVAQIVYEGIADMSFEFDRTDFDEESGTTLIRLPGGAQFVVKVVGV